MCGKIERKIGGTGMKLRQTLVDYWEGKYDKHPKWGRVLRALFYVGVAMVIIGGRLLGLF